jgi:hypothetical protein
LSPSAYCMPGCPAVCRASRRIASSTTPSTLIWLRFSRHAVYLASSV